MIKLIKKYTLGLLVILICIPGGAMAATSESETAALDLINQIRTAPFAYGVGLGYDSATLTSRGILPETQLEPYGMDAFLSAGAAVANTDLPGEPLVLSEADPDYLSTAETGGVVSFFNFMPAKSAAKIVVDNLLKNEIETNKFQYILSPAYSSVGISISPGVLENRMNAWFITIRLGSMMLKTEAQMLNLINQLRSDPWEALSYVGTDIGDIFSKNQNMFEWLYGTYAPLFFDSSLAASAKARAHSLLYKTEEPLTLASPLERSISQGYKGEAVVEAVAAVLCDLDTPNFYVKDLFSTFVLDELKNQHNGPMIFSNDFQDIGPGISFVSGDPSDDRAVLVLETGTKNTVDTEEVDTDQVDTVQAPRIYGLVFSDNDGDLLYDPGEEIVQQSVTVYDKNMHKVTSVVTDNVGHFSVTLLAGEKYYFSYQPEGVKVSPVVEGHVITTDQFVKLVCPPTSL